MKQFAVAILALCFVSACQTNDPDNKRAAGAVGGAVLGAFLGYSIGNGSGEAIMALLGAGAGGAAGLYATDYIIKRDKKKMQKAAYETLSDGEDGTTVYWENQETGSAGSFTIIRSYLAQDGRLCRELTAKVMGERNTTEQRQTACRLNSGSWELI